MQCLRLLLLAHQGIHPGAGQGIPEGVRLRQAAGGAARPRGADDLPALGLGSIALQAMGERGRHRSPREALARHLRRRQGHGHRAELLHGCGDGRLPHAAGKEMRHLPHQAGVRVPAVPVQQEPCLRPLLFRHGCPILFRRMRGNGEDTAGAARRQGECRPVFDGGLPQRRVPQCPAERPHDRVEQQDHHRADAGEEAPAGHEPALRGAEEEDALLAPGGLHRFPGGVRPSQQGGA